MIDHWLVGYGYDQSGARSYFADPATTVWSGVNAKFIYSSTGFANSFIKPSGNGVVY
ncbi:hypothetical protein ACIA49_28740 [Kribbella sp. NPDC051587]|uniref:hypothetical protein n=1 Tax=Kribbella sp. NPDC051587 TaxID=3364119 RepID=UPI0037880527